MNFSEILRQYEGQKVVINNNEERMLTEIGADFLKLEGGNPQMKIVEYVHFSQIVRVIYNEFTSTGQNSVSFDLTLSAGDQRRSSAH